MNEVIPFQRRATAPAANDETQQHAHGEAFCISCAHRWQAVAPVGSIAFECPGCGAHKGRWVFEFYPGEGLRVRVCLCGNQLFYLTEDGHLCANCGIYQRY